MLSVKRFWWVICASIKGMSYEEYILRRRIALERKLAELPEIDNYLSMLREYYSLKSFRRTLEVLTPFIAASPVIFLVMVWRPEYATICIGLLTGIWVGQLSLFSVGIAVRKRYPN